jgi:hypothetical protein
MLECRKYNFKGKKRKITDEDDEQELAESVRTISALFQTGNNSVLPPQDVDEPLEVRVASISAEIAAAIAQAQARGYDDEEDEDGEESGSGQEMGTIGPNTSGIRGVSVSDVGGHGERPNSGTREGEEEEDSDAFPAPLRARKAREMAAASSKRKR